MKMIKIKAGELAPPSIKSKTANSFIRNNWRPIALISPTIIYLMLITLFPIINTVDLSFQNVYLTQQFKPIEYIGLKNYSEFLSSREAHDAMIKTLIYLSGIIIQVILGVALAVLMNHYTSHIKGIGVYRVLLSLPIFVTPFVSGILWRYMFGYEFGLIYHIGSFLGLENILWLQSSSLVMLTVVIVDIWQWTPFIFFIVYAGLQGLPKEPYEAAYVDGASHWKTFRYLTLPMALPIITLAAMLRFILSFQAFDTIWAMTQGGPANGSQILPVYLFKAAFSTFNTSYASAIAVLILVFIIIIGQSIGKLLSKEVNRQG
ncbi:carbohydrate ABC transporter permease [Alteribacillus sp. YIM 98480]|uniref:carbohydrate ABC transporter permease n=1 Tax=Alteribacillus sp. YIM 98480 TaxID=2606599 RepID=UPI00131D8343|nr:sugar ABC transporter permease [Alteribacillus sp. YIM 98480]